jgi:hypothetical protein
MTLSGHCPYTVATRQRLPQLLPFCFYSHLAVLNAEISPRDLEALGEMLRLGCLSAVASIHRWRHQRLRRSPRHAATPRTPAVLGSVIVAATQTKRVYGAYRAFVFDRTTQNGSFCPFFPFYGSAKILQASSLPLASLRHWNPRISPHFALFRPRERPNNKVKSGTMPCGAFRSAAQCCRR